MISKAYVLKHRAVKRQTGQQPKGKGLNEEPREGEFWE